MKNLLFCFLTLMGIAGLNNSSTAQPQYYNYTGAGNGSNSFPFNVAGGKDVQIIYLAGDFNQPSAAPAGNILSVSIFMNAGMGPVTYTDLTIKLAQSTLTGLTAGAFYAGTMTTVYYKASVTVSCTASSWLTFTLDTPFPYDPTQSLIVDIGQCGGTGTLGGTCAYTNLTGVRRVWSVGGCPFACYNSSSIYVYNFGVNIGAATAAPTVVTTAATSITTTGASLNGTVNANGASTTVSFDWGLTAAYGNTVAGVPVTITGNTVTASTAAITGLSPNTLYHYRISGTNPVGSASGTDLTFTTAAAPPTVVTNPATNIAVSSAQLNGTVTAINASTNVSFDWGLTAAYGNNIAATPATVSGNTATPVLANLTGLTTGMTYHYRCVGVNTGGTTNGLDQSFVVGCLMPVAAGAITGPSNICANSSGNVFTVGTITNALTYTWGIPAGAVIASGTGTPTITVTFGSTSGNVTVAGTNGCGSGTQSAMAITVNPYPVPTITGTASGCQGMSAVYTTQPGMTGYTWTTSAGGSITAGAGTNAVTVTWNASGAQTVSVNYTSANGCTGTAPVSFPVSVTVGPVVSITGTSNLCVSSGYIIYTTQSGFSNYAWTVSPGGSIFWGQGTNQVLVSWNQPGAQWVAANYTNSTGCSAPAPVQFPVTVIPLPGAAGTITGTATVCAGATGVVYTVPAITGAIAYVWGLPTGATLVTGANTNSIVVAFAPNAPSGNITVYGNNVCGNGPVSQPFAVTVNPLPAAAGPITGQPGVCINATGVAYNVFPIAQATSYIWTLPMGATYVSGGTPNSIMVNFGSTIGTGVIKVQGTNACGNGVASPGYNVFMSAIPAATVVTAVGPVLTSSAANGNQWYYEGTAIAGADGHTYTVTHNTGYYWCVEISNLCSSPISNKVWVGITGQMELESSNFSVYPVPNDGRFTVSVTSLVQETYTIAVYNQLGAKIFEQHDWQVNGKTEKQIDLRPLASGIYLVVFLNNEHHVVKKIFVTN